MMAVYTYRSEHSVIGPRIPVRSSRTETPVGKLRVLQFPEPPSLNMMIDMAKERTRKTRNGGFMPRALPVVYDQKLEAYEAEAAALLDAQDQRAPHTPWSSWSLIQADFRLHNLRDPIELLASLKWPVDVLVRRGWVQDDSPQELREICIPTQRINRTNRGVVLVIRRDG
jgi:hypothetical protein